MQMTGVGLDRRNARRAASISERGLGCSAGAPPGQLAQQLETVHPAVAEKLKRASPHWMRHTHASHALRRGVALTTVRDNLRHASISTTSTYLHCDGQRRAHEIAAALDVNTPAGRRLTATPQ